MDPAGFLPQIHVSIQPVADNIRAGSSWTAAHNDDDNSLHRKHIEDQRQDEGCERHDAKLAEEANEDAPGSLDVAPQLRDINGAAHAEHDQGKHDGEHCAQHRAQYGIEVTGGHKTVCAWADCGMFLAALGYCSYRHCEQGSWFPIWETEIPGDNSRFTFTGVPEGDGERHWQLPSSSLLFMPFLLQANTIGRENQVGKNQKLTHT